MRAKEDSGNGISKDASSMCICEECFISPANAIFNKKDGDRGRDIYTTYLNMYDGE